MHSKMKTAKGFTLIEILVVIGIIAILAAIVIIAINPARQFAQARNSQRTSNVNALLNAIGQDLADNKGQFVCTGGDTLPAVGTISTTSKTDLNIRPCLVPTYMPEFPVDPSSPNAKNTCTTAACSGAGEDYDTEYTVSVSNTGRVTVCAPYGSETPIPGSTSICVTR